MTITNGILIYNQPGEDQTLAGATVTYTCNTGYTLSGNSMRTCQASGAWSGTAPTCNGEYMWQSWVELNIIPLCNLIALLQSWVELNIIPLCNLIALLRSKRCSVIKGGALIYTQRRCMNT